MKAQVSTEYLVILAVVLVIALVVVFLVSQGSTVGAGVTESQSKNYWNTQSPFSIVNWKITGTTAELEVTNRDAQTLTLDEVTADGTSAYSTPVKFTTGQTRTIILTGLTACTVGEKVDYDIDFLYTKGNLTALEQSGDKNVIGTCV